MTPLVFVHGFMGGSRQWADQMASFVDREIITLDLPGYGQNCEVPGLESIEDFANWSLAQVRAKGASSFDLIGHSMGGMIAQEMVHRASKNIGKLILYGTGATGRLPGRFETIEMSKHRAHQDGPQKTARRISATWFLKGDKDLSYEGCAKIAEKTHLNTMIQGLDAMDSWSGKDRLSAISCDTLVLAGDNDRTYSWAQTEQLWQSIEKCKLAVVPNASHATHLEKPEIFNAIIRDFLST